MDYSKWDTLVDSDEDSDGDKTITIINTNWGICKNSTKIMVWRDDKQSEKDYTKCIVCGTLKKDAKNKKMFKCRKCFSVAYCCKKHQEIDWKNHKNYCKYINEKKCGVMKLFRSSWQIYENRQEKGQPLFTTIWNGKTGCNIFRATFNKEGYFLIEPMNKENYSIELKKRFGEKAAKFEKLGAEWTERGGFHWCVVDDENMVSLARM